MTKLIEKVFLQKSLYGCLGKMKRKDILKNLRDKDNKSNLK